MSAANAEESGGIVATLGPGAFFGEMSLISDAGRTLASVRVSQACVSMYLDREAYHRVCAQYPTFRNYVEAVVRLRLKTTVHAKHSGGGGAKLDEMSVQEMIHNAEGAIVKKGKPALRLRDRGKRGSLLHVLCPSKGRRTFNGAYGGGRNSHGGSAGPGARSTTSSSDVQQL